jgi:cell division protein FtsW
MNPTATRPAAPRAEPRRSCPRPQGRRVASSDAGTRPARSLKEAAPVSYHLVWITALLLLTAGLCTVLSVSVAEGVRGGDRFVYARPQGIVAVVGFVLMALLSRADYRKLRAASIALLGIVTVSLMIVHIPGVAQSENGASSWIQLGPLTYQPSEFAKLAVVLAGAHLLSSPRLKSGSFSSFVWPFGAMGLVMCALVMWENDFGTAIIIAGLVLGMLWLAGMKGKQWLLLTGGGLVAGVAVVVLTSGGKRLSRITAMFDVSANAQGTGYQLRQSLMALGRGGWFGVGPGESVQKFAYLPEAHNDMIYAILGEEFGFVGAGLVIVLFAGFAVACWRLARQCADAMGKYLIAGCGMIVTLQAAVNIGGVIGAIPLTGVPLPFVSYGRNSLLVMLMAVGLILAVAKRASVRTAPCPATRCENVTRIDRRRWDSRARGARSGAG